MASPGINTKELKKLVLMAKQRPMNFAFNPGSKADDLLLLDKKKPPATLGREAKKDGEGKKVAFGVIEISERVISVEAEQSVEGLEKRLTRFFKSLDIQLPVSVHETADQDAAAADAQEAGHADTPETAPDDDTVARAELARRVRDLRVPVGALGPEGATIRKAIAMSVGLMKDGALDKAAAIIGKIETTLAKSAPQPAAASDAGPDRRALLARAGTVKTDIAALDDPRAERLKKQLAKALALLKAGDAAGAEKALNLAETAARKLAEAGAAAAPSQAEARTPPENPPAAAPQDERGEAAQAVSEADRFQTEDPQAAAPEAGEQDAPEAASEDDRSETEEPQATPGAEPVDPAALAAIPGIHADWTRARNGIFVDIEKLKIAIEARAGTIPALAPAIRNLSVLEDHIGALDDRLEMSLAALARATRAADAARLRQEALGAVGAYRQTLDSEFFRAVDQNGFTRTQIRDRALNALGSVENALTA